MTEANVGVRAAPSTMDLARLEGGNVGHRKKEFETRSGEND